MATEKGTMKEIEDRLGKIKSVLKNKKLNPILAKQLRLLVLETVVFLRVAKGLMEKSGTAHLPGDLIEKAKLTEAKIKRLGGDPKVLDGFVGRDIQRFRGTQGVWVTRGDGRKIFIPTKELRSISSVLDASNASRKIKSERSKLARVGVLTANTLNVVLSTLDVVFDGLTGFIGV